jgi:hypothetical protein
MKRYRSSGIDAQPGEARWRTALAWLAVAVLWLLAGPAGAQGVNDGFDPAPNGSITALRLFPDGDLLVGGAFNTIAGQSRSGLARLRPDGAVASGFANTVVVGEINDIAFDANGRVILVGDFSQVGGVPRARIARLNANGTLDAGFNPGANARVRAVLVQADGHLMLAGEFTALGGAPGSRASTPPE